MSVTSFKGKRLERQVHATHDDQTHTDLGQSVMDAHRLRSVSTHVAGDSVNPLPSPERIKDGTCGHTRDFALLRPLERSGEVSPTRIGLLPVIENTSSAFIDLAQDETRVAGRGRVGIHRRKLRTLGHVIAQESFLSGTVVCRLHPRPVTLKDAVTLRYLIGWGNNDEDKLNLVVVGHSRFSEFNCV
jgi:hypothetical protein